MSSMFAVPEELRHRPLARRVALEAGIPRDVLQGPQFRRLHEAVYCHRDHELTWADRVLAARLALPTEARTTGVTRLQELGLDHGPRAPLHFVVEGDLHLVLEGVFLHRTVLMPPHDAQGVTVEAAYVAHCSEARVLDAITMGCELLRLGWLDVQALHQLLVEQQWRRGAAETLWVLPYLDERCRSIPEAELLTLLRWAGLPEPEVNLTIELAPGVALTPDLWWPAYRTAAEYEGARHQEDRGQYNADIDRFAAYRRHEARYVQITRERMRSPRDTVRSVHAELVAGGYVGPAPEFGQLWSMLFARLADIARPRPRRGRAAA